MEIDFLLQLFLISPSTHSGNSADRSSSDKGKVIFNTVKRVSIRVLIPPIVARTSPHAPEKGYGCAMLPAGGTGNPACFIPHTFQPLIHMITGIPEKVKGFLMNPVDAFRQAKGDEPGAGLPYFALLLLLYSLISALLVSAMIGTLPIPGLVTGGISGAVLVFFLILVGGFAGALVFGAWLHLWVYIFGGRRGIWQTLKAVMYGNTPFLLFGWIPFIGFVFTLWSLVLGILGIRELQEISPIKAILAVALAVMIPLILLLILAAFFMIASVTTTGPVPLAGQS